MLGCADILCGFWPFSSNKEEAKRKDVGANKKDDELAKRTEDIALQTLGKLCGKRELLHSDYQKIAEKYVEIFRFHKDCLDRADDSLKSAIPHSEGFVKQFDSAVVVEMDKVLSPYQKEMLCTRVSGRIH